MKIFLVAGARPNFMKIAPIVRAINEKNRINEINQIDCKVVHTGQHYDYEMSQSFFDELEMGRPDIFLGVGSGSHAVQTARIMTAFEKVCLKEQPDIVVVVGDVNSTMSCAIVAAKLCIPVAHVEAGLRSFDRTMPEEINRVVTDALADFLFTTEKSGNENLIKEGIRPEKIFFVGNVMIDTLLKFKTKANDNARMKLDNKDYALLTLHRPSNVDKEDVFKNILNTLQEISRDIPILFPAHPRTQKQIKSFGFDRDFNFTEITPGNAVSLKRTINLSSPLSYLEFLNLMSKAKFVFTDSGGIQEETTILGIPCLTLRENTERPVTIEEGTNILVGNNRTKILEESYKILDGNGKKGKIPHLWDGKASERIVNIFLGRPYEPFQPKNEVNVGTI
ncbi:MAG: UDP-N-acetylglucosamine 2-epimerase (non-hydrolyzing) [Deltaproteobacteria bacterium]|nr:UDP-N-acetylglucosamine 2-epimerase (non-hydrolyzing) [Deltaproteobacteria bacterium]